LICTAGRSQGERLSLAVIRKAALEYLDNNDITDEKKEELVEELRNHRELKQKGLHALGINVSLTCFIISYLTDFCTVGPKADSLISMRTECSELIAAGLHMHLSLFSLHTPTDFDKNPL
jgi:hypothetical protein